MTHEIPPPPARWRTRLPLIVLIALAIATAAILPFATTGSQRKDFYAFELEVASDQTGMAQVFFDVGRGISEADSTTRPLLKSATPKPYRFALPSGKLTGLRFDPINGSGKFRLRHARITNRAGRVLCELSPSAYHADHDIQSIRKEGDSVLIDTGPTAVDPYLSFQLPHPIDLHYGRREAFIANASLFVEVFIGTLLLAVGLSLWRETRPSSVERWIGCATARPKITLAILAAVSVAWQLHPVIFCGKSFASPNNPTFLLYDHFPTLPGYDSDDLEDQKGSDVGAFMYQHFNYPALQQKAVVHDHELPLWNRYNLCGVPLLGQGQSMFGELLNFLPLLAKSSAWSWDVKFILARWLYAFGLALAVWQLTRSLGASTIVALTAAWIGFFSFRATHPAQFAVCFGPWILVTWNWLASADRRSAVLVAGGSLILANWEVITSGTVKEAYMMLPCANLAGLLVFLAQGWKSRGQLILKLSVAVGAGIVFALLTAPLWWTFLDTLAMSRTSYDTPAANQIPGWQIIGLFDDMAYRHFTPAEIHGNPSTNLFVLFGVAWMMGSISAKRWRTEAALLVAATVPASLAFSLVPASLILKIPMLANIYHVGNTFSCPLLILATVAGGVGFADFLPQLRTRLSLRSVAIACSFVVLLIALYAPYEKAAPLSAFYSAYKIQLFVASITIIAAVRWRKTIGSAGLVAVVIAGGIVLVWRHGQYVRTGLDEYVFNPKLRVDLYASSPAIDVIAAREAEPERITGLSMNLYCGANQLYFQEGIYGVDAVRSPLYDRFALAAGLRKVLFWGDSNYGGERDESRGALDMLNVRDYLDHPGLHTAAPRGLKKLEDLDLEILESPTAWPRAFFTNDIRSAASLPEFLRQLHSSDGRPFATVMRDDHTALHAVETVARVDAPPLTRAARDYHLTSNTTSFTVDAPSAGVIVLSETYYPKDFRAYLNDEPAPYYPINYAFKGIVVAQPGTYVVRFEYWPHHLTASLLAAGIGLLLLVAAGLAAWKFEKQDRQLMQNAA